MVFGRLSLERVLWLSHSNVLNSLHICVINLAGNVIAVNVLGRKV